MLNKEETKSFVLNRKVIHYKDTKNVQAETSFERDTLNFVCDWLSDQTTFKFRTSGSTGTPKVISISRQQIISSINNTVEYLQLTKATKALLCIPVANTGGKMMIARALHIGMPLECIEPNGNPLIDIQSIPDFIAVVPLQLQKMIEDSTTLEIINKIDIVIVGGAAVSKELLNKIKNLKCKVFATYGMTETVSHIALKLLNTQNEDSHFHLLPGNSIDVDDRGCLKIKGHVTQNKWIQTNDLVKTFSPRSFEWLGRYDRVINSGGIKIQAEQLEEKIIDLFSEIQITRDFFIHGVKDMILGEKCVLVIQGAPLGAATEDIFYRKLKKNTPQHHQPREIIYVSEFKTTASGKVDRPGTIFNSIRL